MNTTTRSMMQSDNLGEFAMNATQPKQKRTDKHEPTPMEALEYIASASILLRDERWKPIAGEYSTAKFEAEYAKVTVADIRRLVAERMAKRREYFTSDYRHEGAPMHRLVVEILGSTVGMNDLINEIAKAGR